LKSARRISAGKTSCWACRGWICSKAS
jgi:hypothetical protein